MIDFEKARAFFLSTDHFAAEALGAEIDAIGEGTAQISVEIKPIHTRIDNAVMGGVFFTLADFAFAVATNDETTRVVSLSNTINFHRQPKGKRLIANASVDSRGKTIITCTVRVTDETGALLATMIATGYQLKSNINKI